jgi:chromate transporter
LILFERLEAIVENPQLHCLLEGIAAAVVGVITATFMQLALATSARVTAPAVALILFAIALAAAWRLKGIWVTPAILAGGAFIGWAGLT